MCNKKELKYIAKNLKINGIVQGVGFRPFVFQQARHLGLAGHVANTSSGVEIHIEGSPHDIEAFEKRFTTSLPPLARITDLESAPVPLKNPEGFSIIQSNRGNTRATMISPDVSICGDCLDELTNPHDRRYRYPFINCTNCGPRYTIIDDIPYDRPNTSMKHFTMCDACLAEYNDPSDRRFHAQPNGCPHCGPQVALYDNKREPIEAEDLFEKTARLIKAGHIVAVKGLGGFHLAADGENDRAMARLREIKARGDKPFAVMCRSMEIVRTFAHVDQGEEELLTSCQSPIVLLRKKEAPHGGLSRFVAPENRYIGVMLPYTPLHHLLFGYNVATMVMTSANRRDEPIAIDNEEAFRTLSDLADYFLIHNRDIYLRSDDSVARKTGGTTQFFRRSRGYVPAPLLLREKAPRILACGGELKNTVCLVKGNKACLSQHIGDLEHPLAYDFFQATIDHLKKILDIEPEIIVHDLHPDYMSTRYAQEQTGAKKVAVQHHHAHIVSCMAENGLDGPVIGLAFDGTGYGTDGHIWGGEVLIARPREFTRAAHLSYVPVPGGEAAVKEPWRMAVSYLHHTFGEDFINLRIPLLKENSGSHVDKNKVRFISQMVAKRVNAPLTSSMGRLFDGISAIVGLCNRISYEGQAAIELEAKAGDHAAKPYEYGWRTTAHGSGPILEIEPQPIIRGVIGDMEAGIPVPLISSRFHNTLISLFVELCCNIRKEQGLDRVVMSGGVFQNATLLSGLMRNLEKNRFQVFTNKQVPPNDGGLSLGQALIAANQAS